MHHTIHRGPRPYEARADTGDPRSERMRELDLMIQQWQDDIRKLEEAEQGSGSWTAARNLQRRVYHARDEINRLYVTDQPKEKPA
jgi:hypothetical protein